jgi:quercetin dioxygenase-like cupin family protein
MRRSTTLTTTIVALAFALVAAQGVAQHEADVFPEVIHHTETVVNTVPGEFKLVTLVLAFEPGAWTPLHFHGGDGLVTVLEGEMTLEVLGHAPRTYGPGEMWPERVGVPHRAGNETDERALLTVTFVLPVDVPTTVPVE